MKTRSPAGFHCAPLLAGLHGAIAHQRRQAQELTFSELEPLGSMPSGVASSLLSNLDHQAQQSCEVPINERYTTAGLQTCTAADV